MWMSPSHPETPDAPAFDMSITVGENTAREMGLTRRDVDEWARYSHGQAHRVDRRRVRSRRRSCRSSTPTATASTRMFTRRRAPAPRRRRSRRSPTLKPLHPELDGATVTAGNAAGLNDAAAAVVVTSRRLRRARTASRRWPGSCRGRRSGVEPARTGMGPTLAIPKALERAGLTIDDIDLFEINEAFCSVPVAAIRTLGIDPTIVNVNGSGCSLGHPIAATGARMVVTMVNELRRRGKTLGCVSMCAGGGMGSALVLEVALMMSSTSISPGKRLLVVGGSPGIGRSTALAAAGAGRRHHRGRSQRGEARRGRRHRGQAAPASPPT